jgi:hypothetical protein
MHILNPYCWQLLTIPDLPNQSEALIATPSRETNSCEIFRKKNGGTTIMISKTTTLSLGLLVFSSTAFSNIIHIPLDHQTIQSGIQIAENGDTIIVAEGTYFENLNLQGKSIVLASEYVLDGNKSHIPNTVIDGSQPVNPDTASVILLINGESSTTKICGLTLTGGSGTVWLDEHGAGTYREGGAILMNGSSAVICHNRIIENRVENDEGVVSTGGGAIRCGDGNPEISHNLIMRNYGKYGGGIVLNYTGAYIHNNVIAKNESASAYSAGTGIWCYNDGVYSKVFDNNTIIENTATGGCGGIAIGATSASMSSNIVWGNTTTSGEQIVTPNAGSYIDNYNLIGTADPLLGWASDEDLRVIIGSPTIDAGDPVSETNDLDGSRNDQGAFGGPSGDMQEYVVGVVELNLLATAPYLSPGVDSMFVSVHLDNPDEELVYVEASLHNSVAIPEVYSPLYDDGTHGDSLAEDGIYGSWLLAPANEIDFTLTSRVSNVGDSLSVMQTHAPTFTTTGPLKLSGISIWNDDPTFFPGARMGFSPMITNMGQTATLQNVHTVAELLTPGILFRNTASFGAIQPLDTAETEVISALNIPSDFPIGTEVVIAYQIYSQENAFWADTLRVMVQAEPVAVVGPDPNNAIPLTFETHAPYPNPFNPATTIHYGLPVDSEVSIAIYNIRGMVVKTYVPGLQQAGWHDQSWNGMNDQGDLLSTGIYLARIEAGYYSRTLKLMYLK